MRAKNKLLALMLISALLLCGCVDTSARIDPAVTLPPEPTPTPTPTPVVAVAELDPELEMAALDSVYDAMGEYIDGADHFKRYISFKGIQVYEQCDDTFLDCVAVNEYSDTLVCALDVAFYGEEEGLLASSRLQTRDGQYVLKLEPGENTLFAQINSDVRLTDKQFQLNFNDALTVLPE